MKFKGHFFYEVNMGGRQVPVIKKGIDDSIALTVKRLGKPIKMEDCFDVPEQVDVIEELRAEEQSFTEIDKLTDTTHIAFWTKCHQLLNGVLKESYLKFKTEKDRRILELADQHKKLAIICRYNLEIEKYAELLKGKRPVKIINGQTKDKQATVDWINQFDEGIVIIQASCSEGYNLSTVPIMVFASLDFSLKNYIQMKGRILRADNLKKNVYIHLIINQTIDGDVYKSLKAKKDFDIAIYGKQSEKKPNYL
jgi:superfamily II DNA or RNA helicase